MAECKTEEFSVDRLMLNVASSLLRDFQGDLNDPCFCSDLLPILRSADIARIRESLPAPTNEMDPATFKAVYQLQSVLKRYRFSKDTYSTSELTEKALMSFRETQTRIAAVRFDELDATSNLVLDVAAMYIAKTLGVYDDEEHRSLCRFGSKASVGVPLRLASEAARWELPISGSHEQIRWFDAEMRNIDCIQEYWVNQLDSDPERSVYNETSSLKLTLVPKTFKSLRAIMPNTTIGSYMSYGLGEIMRKRLKRLGLDLRKAQVRHRDLAREASMHNLHVTADLSSASDSISTRLVERLFPPDWFEILNRSRIGTVDLPDGSSVEMETFCTMGIGFTFQLQTLVFLSLLVAIQAIFFHRTDRRTISVYGDDLIYSGRMHEHVVRYFEKFGFVINLDKTFHEGHFRESCGGDYYHGVDVRPFQPRNGSATVGKATYEAVLYKYVNGLLARWSEYEIERTLQYLCSELEFVAGKLKLVPHDYPDDSGVKCPTLASHAFLTSVKCVRPKHLGSGVFRFPFLRLVPDRREENRHEPYLWSALRGTTLPVFDHSGRSGMQGSQSILQHFLNELLRVDCSIESLKRQEAHPIRMSRSKITGIRFRRELTVVTISGTGRYKRQSGTSCFGVRR